MENQFQNLLQIFNNYNKDILETDNYFEFSPNEDFNSFEKRNEQFQDQWLRIYENGLTVVDTLEIFIKTVDNYNNSILQ